MSRRPRRNHSPAFKAKVALAGDVGSQTDFIFQQYVKSSHGRDVRLFVVGDTVAAAMEGRSPNGGFKSNISLGGIGVCIQPPPEMAQLAIDAAGILRLDIAGIDVLYDENGYRICEANSSPRFEGLEAACSISVPDRVFDFVTARLHPPAPPRKPLWRRLVPALRSSEHASMKQKR